MYKIRSIKKEDNEALGAIIKNNLIDLGCDSEYLSDSNLLDDIYSQYSKKNNRYWVVIDNDCSQVFGGAGYSPLKKSGSQKICELQKMYLSPQVQGKGLGKILLDKILQQAKEDGFQEIYLETMPQLKRAINLYLKNGFKIISTPKGRTGHNSCTIFMIRSL